MFIQTWLLIIVYPILVGVMVFLIAYYGAGESLQNSLVCFLVSKFIVLCITATYVSTRPPRAALLHDEI